LGEGLPGPKGCEDQRRDKKQKRPHGSLA
jgi:hypothetical protein